MLKIRPKKWDEFQHYKDRNPPWIKLHRKILDDVVFQRLQRASQALAPMLWIIASEHPEGIIDANPEDLAFRLRWPEPELSDALSPLIGKGFFDVVQFPKDRSIRALAGCSQDIAPERETEKRESREETPIVPLKRDGARSAAKADRKQHAIEILEFLNGRAGRHFKPVPANLKFIEARLAEGVTTQDLKTLTVRKCREWLGKDMEKFLRPETLFGATKCHSYLGEIPPEDSCNVPNVVAASEPESNPVSADGVCPTPPTRSAATPATAAAPGSELVAVGAYFRAH